MFGELSKTSDVRSGNSKSRAMDSDSPRATIKCVLSRRLVLTLSVYLVLVASLCTLFFRSQYRLIPSRAYCKCENLNEASFRIVNGTTNQALERGLPWVSFLFYELQASGDKRVHVSCTSAVISRYWVLTGKQQHFR